MIESLEERANRARQSIDEVTGSVTDREFDPPRRHVGTVAAVLFAVVLAVGGVWAILRGDGPQVADVAADGPDAVSATEDEPTITDEPAETDTPVGTPGPLAPGAFLVFAEPPAGFEPMIFEWPGPESEAEPTFDIYGATGDTPFADQDLVVASVTVPPGESLVDPETPSVDVDGQTIYLEGDEGFNVVSWFRDEEGTGLLSYSFTQDELLELMTGLVRNGELNLEGLTLLLENAQLSSSGIGGPGNVFYRPANGGGPTDPGAVDTIAISSSPSDDSVLVDWFRMAEGDRTPIPPRTAESVEHNGWIIEANISTVGGLELRFELDGIPISVTMLSDDESTTPALEDALALLGDIRAATPAEIEAMTARGEDEMEG